MRMYSQSGFSTMSVLSCSGFICKIRQYVPVYDAMNIHDEGTSVRVVVIGRPYLEFYTIYNENLIAV